jgi:hypothetical protein
MYIMDQRTEDFLHWFDGLTKESKDYAYGIVKAMSIAENSTRKAIRDQIGRMNFSLSGKRSA